MVHTNQPGHSHVLDIGIASLTQQLESDMNASSSRPRLIIKKDANLTFTRNVDEYDPHPRYVSIGPYNWSRSDSSPLAREAEKIRCCEAVLGASSMSVRVQREQYILRELETLEFEGSARSWNGEDLPDMTRAEFVRMLLLDGCYILVRFGRVNVSDGNDANGLEQEGDNTDRLEHVALARDGNGAPMANTAPPVAAAGGDTDRREHVDVVRDVFYLVENQIPYFVIETILSKTGGKESAESNIAAYVRHLLKGHQYVAATPEDEALTKSRHLLTESGHLLHLLHLHLKPSSIDLVSATDGTSATGGLGHLLHRLHLHLKPIIDLVSATGCTSATDPSVGRWRTATEYDFAGIKLKKRALSTEEARCILDVRMGRRGGTLHVPCLNIDGETWRILRNLTALEQHNPVVGSHVTAYCVFMSQVACNPQDVALLSKEGIIVHQMGNDGEVADHFANLCKGVVFDANDPTYNYLRETCQELEKRFRSRWGRWMAWLRRKYLSNPWLVVGLVAAAIGLACAVVQTVYSVLGYYNKRTN